MADHETATYTSRLSREIDAAYEGYRLNEPQCSERLYQAFQAQARNVSFQLGWDDSFFARDAAGRAFMALPKFRGGSKVSTWFYRIAQNEAKRALRRRIIERNREVSLNDDGEDPEKLLKPLEPLLAAKQVNQDASLDVAVLRKGLPMAQAEVLDLHDEGYSLEQIAERLGEPLGTIRGRYTLAKKKMRRKVQREPDTE